MLFALKLVKFAVQNDSLCLNLNKIHVTQFKDTGNYHFTPFVYLFMFGNCRHNNQLVLKFISLKVSPFLQLSNTK